MKKRTVSLIRFAAFLQLGISAILIVAVLWAYSTYHASYGNLSRSLAGTMSSTATLVSRVANTLKLRQEVFDQTAATLKDVRVMVEHVDTAAKNLTPRLTKYGKELTTVATLLGRTGDQLNGAANHLLVSVPSRVHMEGLRPVLDYSKPFEGAANGLKAHGADLRTIGIAVHDIASTISEDAPAMTQAFADSTRQTLKLVDVTLKAVGNIGAQELPQAVNDLEAASRQLQAASTQVEAGGRFAVVLLAVGLLVGTLFAMNGVGFLLITSGVIGLAEKRLLQESEDH